MRPTLATEAVEAAVLRRRPPRFLARAGCLLVCLCAPGCAVRKAVTMDDFKSSGRAIEVLEGGPFSEQRMYILADDEFVVVIREPRDLGAGLCRFDLSRQELSRSTTQTSAGGMGLPIVPRR